jgi:hypothetical protein
LANWRRIAGCNLPSSRLRRWAGIELVLTKVSRRAFKYLVVVICFFSLLSLLQIHTSSFILHPPWLLSNTVLNGNKHLPSISTIVAICLIMRTN